MDIGAEITERDRSSAVAREGRSRSAVRRSRWWLRTRRAAVLAGVTVALLAGANAFVAQPFLIPSRSMENTLRVDDRILVNKLAYRFGDEVLRGDVVVFDGTGSFVREGAAAQTNPVAGFFREVAAAAGFARPGETDYVKRVVGVGGDRVACCDERGRITVNGVAVHESEVLYPKDAPSDSPFDVAVPPGRLFVLGDHRSGSRDSRDHLGAPGGGMVPVDRVIGRVDRIVWPPSRWSPLERPEGYAAVPEAARG